MNKSELAAAVSSVTGLSKADAGRAVDAVIDTITAEVAAGNKVAVQGFGTFALKERAARTAKNPKTGEVIQVAAKKVGKFTPGSNLKF
jgi:DNA-binding protein HU-beta